MPYLLLVTTINWDSMVEGNVYLVCQIYHTIPFIKSAECNTNDVCNRDSFINRLRAKKGPAPPLENFADISYLEENFEPHLLRDVCTLCSGALVSDSMLHMLL